MAGGNQSEKEFFSLVATGRSGVEQMLTQYGPEMRRVAVANVAKEFDTWTQRALVEVTTNTNLAEVISTKAGIHSVYAALAKAATMGLQIGGAFPHAYLTPKNGKAVLMPSQDGYIFACTFGPGAVLQSAPDLHEVYEKDTFSVDEAAGSYDHKYAPFGDRGKLIGFFTALDFKDGRRAIRHITIAEVEAIEKGYGQTNSPAYQKSLIDMHRKTAMKKMLKPVVKICEGLAMLMAMDEYPVADSAEPPVMRDVTERMASRLDVAAEALAPAEIAAESVAVEEKKPETKKTPEADGSLDIF